MEDEEMVTITKKVYDQLCADSEKLTALESGGVDNWEWYWESLKNAGLVGNDDD